MPTEFLGAGRQTDIPRVSQNGEVFTAISPEQFSEYSSTMPEFGKNEFAPTYENEQAKYYNSNDLSKINTLAGTYDYLKKINPLRTKTETWKPDPALVAERKWWDSTPVRPDPSLGYREIQGGDENGVAGASMWVRDVADPLSYDQFWSEYGTTPEGGWSDSNIKRSFDPFNRTKPVLQRWQDDASYLPNFSLYGSGSPEDIQRGFNVLQRMSPQNIGEFWSLSHAAQKGMLENPDVALQQMQSLANPANNDWLSIGAEGGFRDINAYNWDAARGLTADPSKYMTIDDSNSGLLGSLGLDMVRPIVEPIGNLAGLVFSGGIPWGSIVMGVDNVSTGNDEALLGNAIGGLASYAGSNVGSGGVMGTNASLGSAAANSAANNMIISAGANYARTGDLENALKAAAFSTASGAAGNWLGSATAGNLGEIGSKALGGAASGGLNSLFTKNSPIEGSLFGAMSGGLHGFLNSTDRSNNTYNKQQNTKNRQTAQAATKLAKLFTKK